MGQKHFTHVGNTKSQNASQILFIRMTVNLKQRTKKQLKKQMNRNETNIKNNKNIFKQPDR